ncbi:hypothetical protein MKX08_002121 [Trichoderma sp. CBMAI-0020]|nr:hypothetical protein MKX08_002121 [Trichoderma sp. CBMAI-0020]
MSKNRKPSSQLRSRGGVGEATQSGCGAEVRRGWAGEGGDQRQLCRRERERRRQATKARVDGGDGLLDLDVGAGRGEFDLGEAENAGRRELVEEEEAGGLEVVATLQPPGIRIGGGPAALSERSQLSTGRAEPVSRDDAGAVVAVGARCRPKEWKEETAGVL